MDTRDWAMIFFCPPLAVHEETGWSWDLILSVCLTLMGWVPGSVHAWWVTRT